MHATSGNELSRVRTEFRLILPSVSSDAYSSREPTLLCNQVEFGRLYLSDYGVLDSNEFSSILMPNRWQ